MIADVANQASASANIATAGLTINSGAWLDLSGFNLTMNDVSATSGLATNSGTLRLKNTQTITNFTNDTDSGTVLINPTTTSTTGLALGNSYYNLILNDGLVGYWKFDEGAGSTTADSSGYGFDGTTTGSPSWSTSIASTLTFTDPYAMDFNSGATTQYVSMGTANPIGVGSDWSATAWVYKRNTADGVIISKRNSWSTGGNQFTLGTGDSINHVNVSKNTTFYNTTMTIPTNSWAFVGVSCNSSGCTVRVNNSTETTSSVGQTGSGTGQTLSIGYIAGQGQDRFNGIIDEVRLYNRALSNAELTALAAGKQPGTSWTSLTLGAALDVNGDLILNSGTLDVDSTNNYQVNVAGDFENNGGVFIPRSGTVVLDGTDQAITAGGTFYNLTKSVSAARTLTFGQNSISTTSGTLTLTGQSGALLTLASAVSGTQAKIDPQGSRSISYVSVSDNNNINDTEIAYSATNTYGSNLTNWSTTAPTSTLTPTPTNTPTPTPTSSSSLATATLTTSSSASSCTNSAPNGTPNLYEIHASGDSSTLYFTPVSGADSYIVSYGTNSGADQFATTFSYANPNGALSYTISSLQPGTTYYFKVQGKNGCKPGNWSNVRSSETESKFTVTTLIAYPDLPAQVYKIVKKVAEETVKEKKIVVKKSDVSSKPSFFTYIVHQGDSLWSIAKEFFGDGKKYLKLIADNKDKHPAIDTGYLAVGTELTVSSFDMTPEKIAKLFPTQAPEKTGYDLNVKVLADSGAPLAGVKVTLHSEPRTSTTNKDGIARFTNVEKGKHTVYLAYGSYSGGGQVINVTGDNKNLELVMQISLTEGFSSPKVLMVIGIMALTILVLLFILFRKKLQARKNHVIIGIVFIVVSLLYLPKQAFADWDVTSASYDNKSFSVSSQETQPLGIFFKTDGTRMYVVGNANDTVYQYTLSTAWDVSTASYDSVSFSVTAQDTVPQALFFKSDGTKMYMSGSSTNRAYQYSLSTPWDLSTASYDSVNFNLASQATGQQGLFFKSDGLKLYTSSGASRRVYQYSLTSPWSLAAGSYDNVSLDVSGQTVGTSVNGLFFKDDGTKVFIVDVTSDKVHQYTLSSAWDLSTATYDNINFSVETQDTLPVDLSFKTDGTKMYVSGDTNNTIYQYSLSTPTPTNTPTPTSSSSSASGTSTTSSETSSCTNTVPSGTPNLYQINAGQNSVELYFTPVSGADSYHIFYGTDASANQFATSFSYSDTSGAVAYTIGSLQSGTTYYFRVRGGNGCAAGNWSAVMSATTDGVDVEQLFVYPDVPKAIVDTVTKVVEKSRKVEITDSKLTTTSNICSYTVQPGDSFWSIAQNKLADGSKYPTLQKLNTIQNLRPGQVLNVPCDKNEEAIAKAEQEIKQEGVSLEVQVLTANHQPVVGATVTLHSEVQVAKTDQNGIARFANVEEGEHKVLLSYNGYNGEQKLFVDGSKKEQTLTLQVNMQGGFASPAVLTVIGVMGGTILLLLFFLIRKNKLSKH